ncbi:BglG family transcription antiterminator [Clostridium sp.]|uniref:BglG family transcription antiterminator n=1 Tax=Clostridium sp. TaxID=1506 RepID=UPI003F674F31
MMSNQRFKKILEVLLENDKVVSGENLCSILGVSSRTIRSDIKEITKMIEGNGGTIISEKSKGYRLEISDKDKFMSFINYGKEEVESDRSEDVIIKLLLNEVQGGESITQIDLADYLFISISSLKNDIKLAKEKLDDYSLGIEKIANKGIGISGREENIRACLNKYLNLERDELEDKEDLLLSEIIKDINIDKVKLILKESINYFNFKASDKAFINVLKYIAIAIKRSSQYKTVFYPLDIKESLMKDPKYYIASRICKAINSVYDISLHLEEELYLTKILASSSSLLIECDYGDELVNKIIRSINERVSVDFSKDKTLIDFLSHHLKAAINRAKYGVVIENSLLSTIKNNYPFSLELAVLANNIINECEGFDLAEDDIGFIALHFAAALERKIGNNNDKVKNAIIVCANGIGASLLLKVKLEGKFNKNINIIDTIPKYEFNNDILEKVDIVISTVKLDIISEKIVYVKSLLDNEETMLIEERLNTNNAKNNSFISRFKEELFFKNISVSTKEDILNYITDEIIKKGYANERFKENIFKREALASTEIGDLVAIPHDMNEDIKESFISISVLKKSITWDKEKVQLVILIGMSNYDKEDLKGYLEKLYKNIIDINKVIEIIKSESFSEIQKIISKF